jgi:hypothetical protein
MDPRSNMSAITSATMVPAGTVITGDVSTSLITVSGLRPSASTRERGRGR